jgi:exosortase F-associated protein
MQKVNVKSAFAIAVLVVLLACVRLFQQKLFYDPLLEFFRHEGKILPQYQGGKLFLGLAFRYLLNSAISLGIIWFCFKDRSILKLTSLLYVVFFVVLIAVFFIVITANSPRLMLLFYIRRFLIQPLFLILFVPAFYYQKHVK